jgi:hypothetical protein
VTARAALRLAAVTPSQRLLTVFSTRRSIVRFSPEQQVDPPPCTPTRRQEAFLARNKLHPGREIDFYEAAHAIGQFVNARRELPPTSRQERFLKDRGRWRDGLSRGEAFDLIRHILADAAGPPVEPGRLG